MKDEERIYFSFCEFLLMMEFSGEGDYILFQEENIPEREEMVRALWLLTKRGMLEERGESFIPSARGAFFRELSAAKHAWYLEASRPARSSTVFYPAAKTDVFYMAEVVPSAAGIQYRVSRITKKGIRDWLFDSGILDLPVLSAEDVPELNAYLSDSSGSGGTEEKGQERTLPEERDVILGIREYGPGGRVLSEAEVFQAGAEQYVAGPETGPEEIFTEEALDRLLARCFGKESDGHS